MKKIIAEEKLGRIFCSCSIVLFAILFYFSFVETWANPYDLDNEFVYVQRDSLLWNTLGLVAVLLVGSLLYQLGKRCICRVNMDAAAIGVCVFSLLFGIFWVAETNTAPQADQYLVCDQAEAFEKGDYSGLAKGEYVGIYRHQLGLITFIRFIYKLFGMGNYQVFQYLNALMLPVLIFSGYQLVKRMSDHNKTVEAYYLLLMLTCVPLYCYVPFVYGEIISTGLVMFAAWMLMWSFERFSWLKVLLMSIALGAAVQFRKNTLIFMIAFLIVTAIHLLRGFHWQKIVIITGIVAGVILFQTYITATYAKLVPEDSLEAPASVYIAMGVNDDLDVPGWHNYYDQIAFKENDYSIEKTNQAAGEYLSTFFNTCKEDPAYGFDFYYRKICAQWNTPMYQCLAMNNRVDGEWGKLAELLYYGFLREPVEGAMNIYHLAVFGSVLALLAVKYKKWKHIDNYLLLIAVFGGFLFSVIWEAKPRYVFPYYVVMLPYAAAGFYECVRMINEKIEKYFRKEAAL